MTKPLVVIPTHNEHENLPSLLPLVWQHCPEASVLVVDDASRDGTPEFVEGHADFGRRLFMIRREAKLGLGTAYIRGFAWALERGGFSHVIEMDADFSHDPRELPRMIALVNQGADLVLGSRYINGVRVLNWPISRLLLSLGAALYVRCVTGMPVSDPTGGYKCFSLEALRRVDWSAIHSNGYSFQIEVTYRLWINGAKIVEHPIVFEDRHSGTSKVSSAIAREAYLVVWRIAAQNAFRRTPRLPLR